jgi:hypothetical protein
MASVNVGRVVIGGVAAGVVMSACDFVINQFILADAWTRVAQARNVDMSAMGGSGDFVKFVAIDLALGLLIVWLYAAIRPRFGPGPGTAAMAAFAVFLAEALVMATFAPWLFSWDMFIRSNALGLVSTLAAGVAGGWVYTEPETESA